MKFLLKMHWVYKIFFIVLAIFYVYLLFFVKGSFLELHLLRKSNKEISHQIIAMEEKTVKLKSEEQKLLHDSAYIDRVLRKKLGVAKKDEKIFILQTVK